MKDEIYPPMSSPMSERSGCLQRHFDAQVTFMGKVVRLKEFK